mgnify:CR=1 FL=1
MRFLNTTFLLLALSCLGVIQACDEQSAKQSNTMDELLAGEALAGETLAEPHYPLDDQLRVNHLQALGTHNSYHLASEINILPWRYSHLALDEQLDRQGVRQFELDIYDQADALSVYHVERLDQESNCADLNICLSLMKAWSDAHLDHHPLLVLLELKSSDRSAPDVIEAIENVVRQTWGQDRVLKPSDVQRDYPTLREGLAAEGWPTLGESRGKVILVLHTSGETREVLVNGENGLQNRLLFPDAYGDLEADYAAYHSINDPIQSYDLIEQVVRAGHLVRTRADVDSEQTVSLDYTRAEQALLSGAHWISTDYPRPASPDEYGFVIPQGTPSRCHPFMAPEECESVAIENLASKSVTSESATSESATSNE